MKKIKISHMENRECFMAYVVMHVNLECLRDGKYPNGEKFKKADEEKALREVEACREILNAHNCEIPVVKPAPQLKLF
jgi:hypothetical protein